MQRLNQLQVATSICEEVSNERGIALVFDFDGVIADTERFHKIAYEKLLHFHGVDTRHFDFSKYMGHSEPEIYKMINNEFRKQLSIKEDKPRRISIFLDYIKKKKLRPFPFVRYLLKECDAPFYILSSQDIDLITYLLSTWKILDVFEDIFVPARFEKSKSALVQELPTLTNTSPQKLVHFEDSAGIVVLSRGLGHRTVFVRHHLNKDIAVEADWEIETWEM